MEYLMELLKEKKQISPFSNFFPHVERLLDEEIARASYSVFRYDLCVEHPKLPKPKGEMVLLHEKVYIPKNNYPDYNFVGRILGPRGMTAKQLEQETGCKIMIRGKGSMRDRSKEENNRGKPNYEHLDDELHVLIQCEDTKDRAAVKLRNAVEQIRKLLVPPNNKGIDELKRKQLMELAIINGTYRPTNQRASSNGGMTPSIASPTTPTYAGGGSCTIGNANGSVSGAGGGGGLLPSSPLAVSSLYSTPLSSPSSGVGSGVGCDFLSNWCHSFDAKDLDDGLV